MGDESHYLWEVNNGPIAVALRFPLIEQLNEQPRGEVSGPLFGLWRDDRTVELINCEHSHGLTEVGYFRIREVPGPPLDSIDRVNISRHFPGRPAIVLAIRRSGTSAARGAFSFWDGDSLDTRFSLLPFPLERDWLVSEGHPSMRAQPVSEETLREVSVLGKSRWRLGVAWFEIRAEITLLGCAALLVAAGVFASQHIWQPKPALSPAVISVPATASGIPPVGAGVPVRAAASGQTPLPMDPPAAVTPLPEPRHTHTVITPAPRQSGAEINFQPVHQSLFGKAFRHVPILARLHHDRDDKFVPARPIRKSPVHVPAQLSRSLDRDVPVDVVLRISKSGTVAKSQVLTRNASPAFSRLALRAASQWTFTPAREHDRPVVSDMLVHFRFHPAVQ